MTKRTERRPRRPRKRRRGAPSSRRPPSGPTLTTPEGDPVIFARARYGLRPGTRDPQAAMADIAQSLRQANDFGASDGMEPGSDETLQFGWYETHPDAKPLPDPLSRRVLALVTLQAETLEGRQKVLDLLDYIERQYPRETRPPGAMSPDYGKAREMLGLE